MTSIPCPIWGTSADQEARGPDSVTVFSDRVGGRYCIGGTAEAQAKSLSSTQKATLTTWIIDQRRAGVEVPFVGSDRINQAKTRRGLRHSQRKTRFFEMLSQADWKLSHTIKIAGQVDTKYTRDRSRLAAWTELEEDELGPFLALLQDEGLLTGQGGEYRLAPKGFEELERVQNGGGPSANAFVAMWFDASMDEAYSKGIEPALRRAGYDPIRIDKKEHNNKIDDEIIADIKRARFIIADFTCATVAGADGKEHALPRGGVYFEAGFAYGLGLPVIWVCREDHMGLVHFDTNHFAHILWNTPEQLDERLYNRIVHVVGLGPSATT